jgi:acetoin utilization deacetylase AcuC-like enzyme
MTSRPVFLHHPSSLEHETGGHPEQPARIAAIEAELVARDWAGFEAIESPPVDLEVLTAVHPEEYVAAIERACASGVRHLDADTIVSPGSFVAALHAAGGAVRLIDLLVGREVEYGFSAHRPPGHHALPTRAMGFCLFNNIAVAARYAISRLGLERVMVVDWDVHHGNGTNDIFHADPRVLLVSIHQSPLYPGTGPAGDVGSGPGTGFTVNLPVPPGSGDGLFDSLVRDVVAPLALSYAPQLILVSAGFDAHRDDPLAECTVTEAGYVAMTLTLRRVAAELDVPLGCVLEGGYALQALARSVAATMEALVQAPVGAAGDGTGGAVAPAAIAARERLRERWPDLA